MIRQGLKMFCDRALARQLVGATDLNVEFQEEGSEVPVVLVLRLARLSKVRA